MRLCRLSNGSINIDFLETMHRLVSKCSAILFHRHRERDKQEFQKETNISFIVIFFFLFLFMDFNTLAALGRWRYFSPPFPFILFTNMILFCFFFFLFCLSVFLWQHSVSDLRRRTHKWFIYDCYTSAIHLALWFNRSLLTTALFLGSKRKKIK